MAVALRRPETNDLASAALVVATACAVGYRGILPDDRLDELLTPTALRSRAENLQVEAEHPEYQMRVAVEEGDVVVGLVGWWRDNGHVEVEALYVHPDRWGTATAGTLIEHVLRAGAAARLPVELWTLEANDRARRFYERNGLALSPRRRLVSYLDQTIAQVRYRSVATT